MNYSALRDVTVNQATHFLTGCYWIKSLKSAGPISTGVANYLIKIDQVPINSIQVSPEINYVDIIYLRSIYNQFY